MERFDLIVIGSGSGLDVANAAAEHGMKVAIIEKDRMGGTCLNRGCIPSKLLLHSADVMETIHNAYLFGIYVHEYSIDYPKIIERVNGIVDPESSEIRKAFDNIKNPRLFPVQCRFVGQKEIQAGDSVITSDKILIACGARPSIPKIEGLEGSGYITSTEALRLKIQPKVLTILGGGYIACELKLARDVPAAKYRENFRLDFQPERLGTCDVSAPLKPLYLWYRGPRSARYEDLVGCDDGIACLDFLLPDKPALYRKESRVFDIIKGFAYLGRFRVHDSIYALDYLWIVNRVFMHVNPKEVRVVDCLHDIGAVKQKF